MSPAKSLGPLYPEGPAPDRLAASSLSREEQWRMYRFLQLTRRLEDRLSTLYRRGKFVGGAYSSRGQEGESVGSAWALAPQDFIAPLIRNLGAQLVRGVRPVDVFAVHLARASAPNRSRDNLPRTNLDKGFLGPIAMLGSMLPVLNGILLGARMRGEDRVGLTWIGDGGASTGEFHEGLNFAAVQSLPVVVIAEHNGYAYSTPTAKQMRAKDIAIRAAGYGIAGEIVDGNDVLAVYEATRRAVTRARRGLGPTLLEVKTFRMKGHAEHDDAHYVPPEVREHWAARDPILRFERHLLAAGWATTEDFTALGRELDAELDADIEAAETAPFPAAEEAAQGIYAPAPPEVAVR